MNRYAVSGKTAATAATVDNAIAAIWNPSAVKPIFVTEVKLFKQAVGAADEPKLRRISARGTATTTNTPGIDNHMDHELAPVSGALLDLAYSAQPTFVAGTAEIDSLLVPAAIGAGVMWTFPVPIRVKAGTGLCLATGIALAMPISRVTFIWDE